MILLVYLDLLDNVNEKECQPFIRIFGKYIIEWIIDYIKLENYTNLIIVYNNEKYKYKIEILIQKYKINTILYNSNSIRESIINIFNKYTLNENKMLCITSKYFYMDNLIINDDTIFYTEDKILDSFFINNINNYINNDTNFKRYKLLNENVIPLITLFQIRLFCNNFPRINAFNNTLMITEKRICFELENTLIIKKDNEYIPNNKNINYLKYLRKIGNKIIINTIYSKEILDIVNLYNIEYDEIYFDRVNADYYIDSKNIIDDNLEKQLGYYNNKIDPRDFNNLELKDLKTYKKSSNDLSGEI
jgi:hypothetical protein